MVDENEKNLAFGFLSNIRKRLRSPPRTRCTILVRWVLCGPLGQNTRVENSDGHFWAVASGLATRWPRGPRSARPHTAALAGGVRGRCLAFASVECAHLSRDRVLASSELEAIFTVSLTHKSPRLVHHLKLMVFSQMVESLRVFPERSSLVQIVENSHRN